MLYVVFVLECVKLCCKPCNFHIQGLFNAVYITLSNGRHKIALLVFILPHELFNASEIGIVLFTLTEGYNLMGYLVNVCRGKLLAAFLNDKVFNVILEKAVTDFYAADPKAIDGNTMELLKSGILTPAEYARLFDAADNGDNATMCRLIAQAAENAAANAKDEDTARQLRYVANKGRGLDGRHYMQAFDSMADTLDRSLRRTYLIKSWDELTANILEKF